MEKTMSEKKFSAEVERWIRKEIISIYENDRSINGKRLSACFGKKFISGNMPYPNRNKDYSDDWCMRSYKREIDIAICLQVKCNGVDIAIPIVAIELKTGKGLATSEVDKQAAVYQLFKNFYSFTQTILLIRNNDKRRMRDDILFRNGAGFDYIVPNWNADGKGCLLSIILAHINYVVRYWTF